jgi:hypothetical protein
MPNTRQLSTFSVTQLSRCEWLFLPLSGRWPTIPGSGPENIHDIVLTYKTTPRKCLDFRTPAEAFLLLKTDIVTLET